MKKDQNTLFTVRFARPEDAVEIGRVIKICIGKTHGRYYTQEEIEAWQNGYRVDKIIEAIGSKTVMVLNMGQEMVGTVKFAPTNGEIGGLYVHPDFQNMGLGCILMNTLLGLLKINGLKEVNLSSNRIFMNWYQEKFGFEVKGKEYVDWGGVQFEEFRMTKSLAPEDPPEPIRNFLPNLYFKGRAGL